MTLPDYEGRTRAPDTNGTGAAKEKAAAAAETAGAAVKDAAGTAKEQASQVAGEAKAQVRNLAGDVRDRVGTEARSQNDRLADSVRRFADELDEMTAQRGESPASKVVTQVSQGGRRMADYLAENGPEGVLQGVQDFARRRPGTFLIAAAAAGFVAGRLGKGVFSAGSTDDAVGRPVTAPSSTLLNAETQRFTPPVVPTTPSTMGAPVAPMTPMPVEPAYSTPPVYADTVIATTGDLPGSTAEPFPHTTSSRP